MIPTLRLWGPNRSVETRKGTYYLVLLLFLHLTLFLSYISKLLERIFPLNIYAAMLVVRKFVVQVAWDQIFAYFHTTIPFLRLTMFCYFSRYTPASGWGIILQSENECCQARVRNSARLPPQTQLGAAVLVLPCRIAAAYKHTGILNKQRPLFCLKRPQMLSFGWSCRPSAVKV